MNWAPKHLPEIGLALWQHLVLSIVAVLIGLVIALVVGIFCARRPRLYAVALTVANVIFVIPSLALFALLIPFVGLGMKPVLIGLSSYCLLILLRNVVTGLRSVPADVLDAADGMGFGPWQRLFRIELPLALPLIVSGARIALATTIGIATVAAFIDGGGLGTIILIGIDQEYPEKIFVGAVLTAALAIGFDFLLTRAERAVVRWQ
ncbi:ABC transporter permease [Neorhizobium alkalisoli]|uniref:Osmoprotectant transport system permease protein n=1 Tax=Neorhizobium alkalisoli TaxID=528178 RepID=A0A561R784_9HYPH|nr:ABC transporter permease [Neorhizobium alkalisoli]TWF58458.1 osmoprotectant transport system permease protein [Neorhizobium alkalisoli]